MRKLSKAAMLCLVLAAQGCTFTLPNGLLKTTGNPGTGGGTVSGEESCSAMFFKLDANGDKELTEDEYVRGRLGNVKAEGQTGTASAQPTDETAKKPTAEEKRQVQDVRTIEDDLRAGFKALDADGNGRVTKDEFLASCDGATTTQKPPRPGTSPIPGVTTAPPILPDDGCSPEFSRYDANRDGQWDRKEYEQFAMRPVPEIAQCISPNDGVVSSDEGGLIANNDSSQIANRELDRDMAEPVCGTPPQYQTHPFEKYDQDHSGLISSREFCAVQGLIAVPPTPPMPPAYDCKETFTRADANRDGRIDLDEYSRADYAPPPPDGLARPAVMPGYDELKRRFLGMDRNQDSFLTPDEFCGSGIEPQPWPSPMPPVNGCEEDFVRQDRNGDGTLAWEEFYREPGPNENVDWATYKDSYYAKFKSYDRNGDGKIDRFEYCGGGTEQPPMPGDRCAEEFKSFDRDQSGFLSFDEYAGGRFNQIQFIQAPSQEEAAKFIYDFKARAKSFDANGDAQLSLEEFARGCN